MPNDVETIKEERFLLRIEDDVVFVRVIGLLMAEDLKAISAAYTQVRNQHGTLFGLYDSQRADGIHRSAREALVNAKERPPETDATAIFGASFALRTMGNMVQRALTGLGRRASPMRFLETESEARAYLQQTKLRLKNGR